MIRRLALALLLSVPVAAAAVQPDEVLPDPGLEARARALSKELRCVVCQGESIDDSNAAIARDLRLLVRERLVAGDRDGEVLDFVVARYGEFVLFRPPFSPGNAALWLAGPVLLAAGLCLVLVFVRRGARTSPPPPLTAAEEARLARLAGAPGDSAGPAPTPAPTIGPLPPPPAAV